MKQGVLVNHRVRLLLDGSTHLFILLIILVTLSLSLIPRTLSFPHPLFPLSFPSPLPASGHYQPDRNGERRRKSVRGCIVGNDLSVLALVIVKRGAADVAGLTDAASDKPSTRGPKRANKIRKVIGLGKKDDVRLFVVSKTLKRADGKKELVKRPKIQRLVTPSMLQHKRRRISLKKSRGVASAAQKAEYTKLVTQLRKETRQAALSKKASSKKAAPATAAAKK